MFASIDGSASALQWSATYDGAGIRASQTDGSGTRVFHTDGDTLLQETGGTAPDTTYTPGFGQRSGSTDRFSHQDWLGSSRYVTDLNGTTQSAGVWSAYGKPEGSTGSVNDTRLRWGSGWGYQSETEDASNEVGLVLMGQRYYDPEVMRFISPDPLGLEAGLNLYAYCDGDPVSNVDPTGLYVQFGNVRIGGGEPQLIFTSGDFIEGVQTGAAATGSALSFGLWDGGDFRCKTGFGVSRQIAEVGREAIITAGTLGAGNAYHGWKTSRLMTRLARKANRVIPGSGPGVGIDRHKYIERVIRRANQRGILNAYDIRPEVIYLKGAEEAVRKKGSAVIDVIQRGNFWRRPKAYDFKFGSARLRQPQINRIRQNGPAGLRHVEEIRP